MKKLILFITGFLLLIGLIQYQPVANARGGLAWSTWKRVLSAIADSSSSIHAYIAADSVLVNNLRIFAEDDSVKINLLRLWAEDDSVRTNLLDIWAAADSGNYNTAYVQSLTELLDADFGSAGIMKTDGAGTYSIVTAIDAIPIGGTTPAAGDFTTLEADTLFISGGNTTYYWAVEHGVTTYGVYK